MIDQLFYRGTLYAALSLNVIEQVAQLLLLKVLRAWLCEFLCGELIPQLLYLPVPGTWCSISTDSWRCLQESNPLLKLSGRDQLSIIERRQSAILLDRYVHGVVDVEVIVPFEFDLLSRQTVSLNERLLWLWLLPLILELRDVIELAYKVSVGVCLQDATIL